MPKVSDYFPFGFTYPKGFPHDENNPDPALESIRERMQYLNEVHALTEIPGHIFAAAMALFQKESHFDADEFWNFIRSQLTKEEVAQIAEILKEHVKDEPPRLEFPNAIALFDCRFVSTREWEYVRHYSIGGSEAAAVLGVAHYQSPRTLYHEKKSYQKEQRSAGSQQILDYGHAVEPYVVGSVASALGAKQRPEYRMFAHSEFPFITCNPDAILELPNGELVLFEAKTAFWMKRSEWKAGIPDYYAPQPRQYLAVLNDPRLTRGFIGVCLGGLPKDMLSHGYHRDMEAEKAQVEKVVAYWKNYIEPGVLPPFSGKEDLDFKAHYHYGQQNTGSTDTMQLPEDTAIEFQRYFDLKADKSALSSEINEVKKEEQSIKNEILTMVPEGLTLFTSPDGMTYKVQVKGYSTSSPMMNKIQTDAPEDAEMMKAIALRQQEIRDPFGSPKVSKSVAKKTKKGSTISA